MAVSLEEGFSDATELQTIDNALQRSRLRTGFKYSGTLYLILVLLVLWQIIGSFLDPIYISKPTIVANNLWNMLFGKTQIWHDIAVSASEMYIGLAIALVIGSVFGLAIGRSRIIRGITAPYVVFLNATPLVITLPLLAIWLGVDEKARIVFIVLLATWPILLNVAAGCRNVSGRFTELGHSAGLSRTDLIRKIIIPGVLPYFLTGARISAGLVVIGMVVSEMEVSLVGLGYLLASYASGFQTSKLLAVFVISTVFGLINVGLLSLATRTWAPWAVLERKDR